MKTFKLITEETLKTGEALHKRLNKHYNFLGHNEEHGNVLKDYTDDSSVHNTYLWNKHKGEKTFIKNNGLDEKTNQMDAALKMHETPHEFHVYSGIRYDPRVHMNKEGIVHHPAYLSTSLRRKTAVSFASLNQSSNPNLTDSDRHIMKIRVPKGHAGAYVHSVSEMPGEKEFILPRGSNLKITHTTMKKEKHILYGLVGVHTHHAEIV